MEFLKSFMKKLILLNLIILIGIGFYQWKTLGPKFLELKTKHPEKYEKMIAKAKVLEIQEAKKLFEELDAMTESDVIMLRFKKMKKKWEMSDDKYRQDQLIERYTALKILKESRRKSYKSKVHEYAVRPVREEKLWLGKHWEKTSPWERGLILRNKCIHYLEKEKQKDANRISRFSLPRSSIYLQTSETVARTSQLCESWIPLSDNEAGVLLVLKNLRNHLDYFYFKQMIQDLGISEEAVLNFKGKTKRFTADYS